MLPKPISQVRPLTDPLPKAASLDTNAGKVSVAGRANSGSSRAGRMVLGLTVLAIGLAAFASGADQARAERNFDPRFSQNVQGDITIAANTIMTCPDTDSRCPAARAGTGSTLNNNQFRMVYVDQDDDPATFNSSTAELILPDGATVLFAGLYYGAKTSAGTGGSQAPSTAARGTVQLKPPGETAYQTLTAAVDDSTEVSRAYGAFVDVTSIVQSAGVGNYTVANVQAGTGEDRYGGWSLVVAYRDSAAPARNLTIFDGLQNVTKAKPAITIGVTGFQTPATGPVRTNLGFVSFEGDRGLGGDNATLNGKVLSTATNPANNFFNSSISKDGVPVTTKQPDYDNQLGYDAVLMKADDFLANGASSAAIRLQTTNETYLPQVISFATELFSPLVTAAKTVENITSPGQAPEAGDTLRYTVTYTNSGGDGATQFTAEDAIPVGTTYAPGTLAVTAGPDPATLTDAIGDDRAEFLPDSNSVRFRLGQGANQTTGGLLTDAGGGANTTTIAFDVTVDSGLPSGTRIVNEATAGFLSQTLGTEQSVESNAAVLEVQAPDLVMSKSHPDPPPGGPVIFTLGVANEGTATTDGSVTVTDSFPAAAFSAITITSSPGWDCSATSGLDLSCTRSDELGAGAEYPPIVVEAAVVGSPPAFFSNTAEVTGGGDPNPTNNVAVDYLPAPPATVDLAVTKTVDQATIATGSRVTWTITARNNGPSPATGVTLSDTVPAGADSGVTVSSGQGTCSVVSGPEVECALGALAVDQVVQITVSATVTATTPGTITNTAVIEGDELDLRPNNNQATASFESAGTADLSIVKAAGPEPTAGEPFTFTLTVTNNGPSAAADLVVNDQIPPLFTPTSVTAPSFDCGSLPPAGGVLECLFNGTLAPGSSATIELTGDLDAASAGVDVINTATASSSLADPNPGDNSSSVTITPLPFADISMSKTSSANSVKAGQAVTWTFGVQNRGPLDADPVILEDELPAGLTVVSLPAECTLQGRSLTCDLGAIADGDSKVFRLTVRTSLGLAGQTVTNRAEISSPRPDPNRANNFDESSFPVRSGKTKLKLKQSVNRKKVRSGGKFTFGLRVKNTSNTSAFNSTVCQNLPRSFRIVRAPKARIGPGRKVCWKIGRLDPGKSRKFTVVTRAFSSRTKSFAAPATLTGQNVTRISRSKTVRVVAPRRSRPPQPVTG